MMAKQATAYRQSSLLQRDLAFFFKALMWLPAHNAALPSSG